ncbi:MAG TPA: alpha/beta hydrolase [Candidatus Acidoferrales bacterium]|nr:alpha/beta hydrolase [Candidatus Acidoferrales bacterium]
MRVGARFTKALPGWRRSVASACATPDSHVIETAVGPVEYAVTGSGPAVLVIHGCPGGYDQGLLAAKLAGSQGFTFISPSRPGYLRTPLEVGLTPEAQADAYAALLDSLGILQAAVIGISGGGPSALQFALRHPQRCWGLVTVCAIARRLSENEIARCRSLARRIACTADLGLELARAAILLARRKARRLLARLGGKADARSGAERGDNFEALLSMIRGFGMISLRKIGLENDIAQLTSMPDYELEKIKTPTLIMHGSADELVPFSHARLLASRIGNAVLVKIKRGGHLFFATHKEKVVPTIVEFLERGARAAGQKDSTKTLSLA